MDDRAIKIDDGGRLHTDLLKAISPTYDRKGEELVGEERWEKMVTEASEKFGGGRLVVVPIEVYEEMAKAREEKERVVEEKRATEEYEREWPLIGEGR